MRYGMNPHQRAEIVGEARQVTVLSGQPSLINWLDLLNAWALVREAAQATGAVVAASFKHVSPAGVATAGPVDECARRAWGLGGGGDSALDGNAALDGNSALDENSVLSAYVRARDVDPKSSFGDVVALSAPCDQATAEFLGRTIADAIIAPGYEDGALERLRRKKSGRFLTVQVDPDYTPPEWETREVFGVTLRQQRDTARIEPSLLGDAGSSAGSSAASSAALSAEQRRDALLGMVTLRYTQSNSVVFGRDGMILGIGAGQQNRVDCTRLAGTKAATWWLRRHPAVLGLDRGDQRRQDHLNWQIRFAESGLTGLQLDTFRDLYGADAAARYHDPSWRGPWRNEAPPLVMCSDGFIPFRDNIDTAAELGATVVVEPGGSVRTGEVAAAAAEHRMVHVTTGLRLFHH